MFKERSQGYSRHMNEHALPTDAGGYLFAFSIRRVALRVAGLCAVAAGAIIAVMANATEPFRIPLGIAMGVLAITLLSAYAFNRSSRRKKLEPAPTPAQTGWHQVTIGKMRGKKSMASELALLAELHTKGALSHEEFSSAKRRVIGG